MGIESEATTAEREAQAAYEEFIQDSNAAVADRNTEITNKSDTRASAEEEKVSAESSHGNTSAEVQRLGEYNAELHGSCDFVLKNFDVRQTARTQEIDAINAAKAILSGSNQ